MSLYVNVIDASFFWIYFFLSSTRFPLFINRIKRVLYTRRVSVFFLSHEYAELFELVPYLSLFMFFKGIYCSSSIPTWL